MADLKKIYDAILKGDANSTKAAVQEALADGADPEVLLNDYMITAMDEVGRLFEANEYFVPEMILSARAMKFGLGVVRPILAEAGGAAATKIVIGTVQDDLHDIGKSLVASMLEGGGFEIVDLGVDVPPEEFVEAIKQHSPRILALSALLTTTMPAMKTTIDALTKAGVRDKVKVIIGGAPITDQYANEIGADGYSANASGAVGLARGLLAGAA